MKHILIIIGIVALATAGWWTQRNTGINPFTGGPATLSPSATSTPSLAPTSTGSLAPKSAVKKYTAAAATPKPSSLQAVETYQDALTIYGASGYRFQFAANCQASPGILTIKAGQKFMLDNRDGTAHAFTVGSQKYAIGAYGFAIASAPGTAGNASITCDGNTRATIVVQP